MTRINSKHDWKDKLYLIIFRANTPAGKLFDIILLIVIFLSTAVVLLDSVPSVHAVHGDLFYILEWVFTGLFTLEYFLRIWIVQRKAKYIFSFLGLIDLLSTLPAYLGLIFVHYQFLLVLRSLRLLRIFKIFKLGRYQEDSRYILRALYASYRKITMFMLFIVLLVVIIGALMYLVEEGHPGFESIPHSIYWAVVTITTVGYGDVAPITPVGKFLAALVMVCGYSIIAVPTGIVTSEMALSAKMQERLQCTRCGAKNHRPDARYCRICAEPLPAFKHKASPSS